MQLQPGDLVATPAPLTFWPELIICLVAWPLLMAHLFPHTRLADPESRFGHGIPAVFVSLAVVAVPAAAALVGIVRIGTSLDELGGSRPLTPYALATALVGVAAALILTLRARGIWTPPKPRLFEPSERRETERAIVVALRLIQVGGEELAFRGFAITVLVPLVRAPWAAAGLASAAFAYAHKGSLFSGRPPRATHLLAVFAVALALSTIRLNSDSGLWLVILIHWAWLAWATVAT